MPRLDSSGAIISVDVGDQDAADIFSDLGSAKFEVALRSNTDLGSFLKSTPTVSQLNTLVGEVDHRISVVRIDTQGCNSFSWDSLNHLS